MIFAVASPRTTASTPRKTAGLAGSVVGALLGLAVTAQAATFSVVNNNDSGAGSLRQAIIDANATAGADTIAFNVASFTIAPTLAFPSLTDAVTIDGTTQPGYAGTPIIVLDGTNAGLTADGLAVRAANCVIKGLTIQNYTGNGISIAGAAVTGCSVSSSRVGTNSAGTVAAPNNNGIAIFNGAKNNTIGGTTAATLNLISGNTANGVLIFGAGTDNNIVQGNRIGTDAAGTAKVGNGTGAIIFGGAKSNHIGIAAGTGNLISGNTGSGVQIFNEGTAGNTVERNLIGTNEAITAALGNGSNGVQVFDGAANNTVGGTVAGAGNLISGNTGNGVLINNAGTSGNLVQGNLIGTNGTGAAAIANGATGVQIQTGATTNTIGGTAALARNVISGNGSSGIKILDIGTTGNLVQGNRIGTNNAVSAAVPNGSNGVEIFAGATNNIIGGSTAGAGNILSGNIGSGIQIFGIGTTGNQVVGNIIGANSTGTAAIANGTLVTPKEGVYITGGAQNNIVGGTAAGEGNLISGNTGNGISISSAGTTGNRIIGNRIGTNAAGNAALANAIHGIEIRSGATDNHVGLLPLASGNNGTAPEGNTIAFNTRDGIRIASVSNDNAIRGNHFSQNGERGINLSGGAEDVNNVNPNDAGDADTGANLLQNYPVLTTANLAGNTIAISGTLNSTASTTFVIDYYSNAVADPSGAGEGQVYLGSANASTDASGNANISFSNTTAGAPAFITATATDPNGNTSEFSLARAVTSVPTFSISGRLTNSSGGAGIGSVSVALSGSITDSVTTNANGDYIFSGVPAGNYTVTPSASAGYSFSPTARNVAITNADVAGQNFAGTATGVRIHGRIATSNGVAIPGVTVRRTGSATTVITNSAGYYMFTAVPPGTYTLTPSRTGYTFSPVSRSVTVAGNDVLSQNFTGTTGPPPAPGFRVHGRISTSSGVAIPNVSVTRTGSATPVATNSAGYYTFTGVPAGTYTVTPTRTGYSFAPTSKSVTVTNADVINQNFIGTSGPPPAPTFQLHGRISNSSGVAISGVTVTRTGTGQTSVLTNSAGYYSFTGVPAGTYTVTPSRTGFSFTPTSRTVTVTNANVVNQNFIGQSGPPPAATYRIHGRIATSNGVAVAGVSVTRTGSATPVVTNSAGYYQFNGVPNGTYTITPSLSGRTFTPASRTVTVNNAETINNNFIASG